MTEGGDHKDEWKLRYDLIPGIPLAGVAAAFTYGAAKYSDRNWEKGIKVSRLTGSAKRHIESFSNRDDYDEESGLHHLDHAICNLMMIRDTLIQHPELDDRPTLPDGLCFRDYAKSLIAVIRRKLAA